MTHHGLGPDHQVRTELDRVLTRLATLGGPRLSRPGDGSAPSAADAVRAVLQPLADAAGEGRHRVPVLADRAVADQLAVLGADALDAPLPVATLADLAGRLTALRRSLP